LGLAIAISVAEFIHSKQDYTQSLLFSIGLEFQSDLAEGVPSVRLRKEFEDKKISLPQDATISLKEEGNKWQIDSKQPIYIIKKEENKLNIYAQSNPQKLPMTHPFLFTALLGFFGGALSAFRKARQSAIDIPSYELIKVHTVLRMLLGAAGSFVVYTAAGWLQVGISELLSSNISMFLIVGIAAGFSERLFVKALEDIADNLSVAGIKEPENKNGSSAD